MAIRPPDQLRSISRRNRWPRFSLRTLLVVLTVLCLWLGLSYASAKRQELAVAVIEKLGGSVGYDWQATPHVSGNTPDPPGPQWPRKLLGPHYFDTVVSANVAHRAIRTSPDRFADFGPLLAELPALKNLSVGNLDLSDAEFEMIGRLRPLEKLIFLNSTITDRGAAYIATLSHLKELGLNDVIVSANAVAEFKKLPRLELLWICCRHLDYGPHNEPRSELQKYALRNDALSVLPDFPRLRKLSIRFAQFTDDGVANLGRMPQLESLELSSPHITNASMEHLTKLQNLKWLGLMACGLDEQGVAMLGAFPKLTGLRISGKAIGNDCLPTIAKLHNLQTLDLSGEAIDDDGLHHLHEMKKLTKLDVQSTAVQTDGPAVRELKKALPNCYIRQYYPSPSFR